MKVKLKLPIEIGKTYYSRDGKKIRIYATDGAEPDTIHGATLMNDGWYYDAWLKTGEYAKDEEFEEDIIYEEWEPEDKELVWCWNDGYPFSRCLRFYDKKNKLTFNSDYGERGSAKFDNYAPYEVEWPDWAKEAQKKLKD